MENAPLMLGAWAMLALVAFAIVLLVVWIVLPFGVLGTKPLLRQLLAEQRRTNALLERIAPPRP